MLDTATYRLLSVESETPRPRVLRAGSLAACLDELKEALLVDVVAANRGTLTVTATLAGARPVEVLTVQTTGNGY